MGSLAEKGQQRVGGCFVEPFSGGQVWEAGWFSLRLGTRPGVEVGALYATGQSFIDQKDRDLASKANTKARTSQSARNPLVTHRTGRVKGGF